MTGQQSKVIGVWIKDRAAILPAGHMADGAYWFDDDAGKWVTSTYYVDKICRPGSAGSMKGSPPPRRRMGMWYPLDAKPGRRRGEGLLHDGQEVPGDGLDASCFEATPWGNEIIEDFAEQARTAEKLGQHSGTDVLAVSFLRQRLRGSCARARIRRKCGTFRSGPTGSSANCWTPSIKVLASATYVVVLTADHGVVSIPEVNEARRMNGGRISTPALIQSDAGRSGQTKYGAGKWIVNIVRYRALAE